MSTNKRKLIEVKSITTDSAHDGATVQEFCDVLLNIESQLLTDPNVSIVKVHLGEWPRGELLLTGYRKETKKENKKRVAKKKKRKLLTLKNEKHVCKIELKRQIQRLKNLKKKIKKL